MKKGLIVFSLLLSLVFVLTGCSTTPQQIVVSNQDVRNVINVNGVGELNAKPDTAYININVSVENKDAKIAQEEATKSMTNIFSKLKEFKIEEKDMTTTNYSIDMIRDYSQPQPMPMTQTTEINFVQPVSKETSLPNPIVGYRVSNSIRITIKDITKVGEITDAISKVENITIDGLSFGLVDDKKAKEELIQLASKNAREQAEITAKSLGVKIKGIKSVSVNTYNQAPMYSSAYKSYDMMERSAITPISSGSIHLNANVNVEFEIE